MYTVLTYVLIYVRNKEINTSIFFKNIYHYYFDYYHDNVTHINTKYTTKLHLLAPRLRLKSWQLLYDQLCCWWWRHRGNRSGQPFGIPFFQSAWFMESFLIRNLFFENSINQHLHMFIIFSLFKRVNLRKISFGTVKNL